MNFKKHSVLIVGCGIALVLLVVAVFFLVTNQNKYRDNVRSLQSAKSRLDGLNNRNPFPSQENIRLSAENLEKIKNSYHSTITTLRRDQLVSEPIEPARFAPMLEESSRRIRGRATELGITLPTEPGLGFRQYAAGTLPPNDPRIMDRLVVQVKAIEDVCLLMLDSRVHSIDTIQRDEFEARPDAIQEAQPEVRGRGRAAAAAPGRQPAPVARAIVGGLPMPASSELYSTERISFSFTGRESAVWEVLNRLVNRRVFYNIVDVSFENSRTDLGKPVDMRLKLSSMLAQARAAQTGQPGAPAVALPTPTLESITRDERVVGGREIIKARVVVDMYRFLDATASEVSQ
ncbi:MAG TPA: Amuc_1100 family pilus-like protein [Kiritimatiellia bacterium]|nr:Amuc_1100 family pilus-like protein [Kiritimatiellia bacterium]